MAKRSYFKDTIKALKNNVVWTAKKGDTVYISEGHIIIKVSIGLYIGYFAGRAAYLPLIPENNVDEVWTYRDGTFKTGDNMDLEKHFNDMVSNPPALYIGRISPLLIDLGKDKNNILARSVFWHTYEGSIDGMLINEKYVKAIEDFTGGTKALNVTDRNAPTWYTDGDNFGIIVLPINYNICTDLHELIKSMNAEANYKKELKRLKEA